MKEREIIQVAMTHFKCHVIVQSKEESGKEKCNTRGAGKMRATLAKRGYDEHKTYRFS